HGKGLRLLDDQKPVLIGAIKIGKAADFFDDAVQRPLEVGDRDRPRQAKIGFKRKRTLISGENKLKRASQRLRAKLERPDELLRQTVTLIGLGHQNVAAERKIKNAVGNL